MAILAAFELVEAAEWPRRLAAIGILARAVSLPVEDRAAKTVSRTGR
jgi:hypothetical protein